MLSNLRYRLRSMFSHIWVPIGAYAVLGLAAAVVAVVLRDLIPSSWAFNIGADAIDGLLNILASSMLAVTTFSLSIMLSAFAAASSTATPRAFQLLKTDHTAQQVLASFIGAFIFSLVGIISLKIGIYGEGGRVILFAATILVLVLIVFNLVRWIGHLTDFGRLGDTMARVEDAASAAMLRRLEQPWLGANPMHRGHAPQDAVPLRSHRVGHVQFVNLETLDEIAQAADCNIYIDVLPGAFVYLNAELVHIVGGPTGADYDTMLTEIRDCFDIGMKRSFDQDPRFGMITMSEIASRALSPAVNDPGTAIEVIRRMTRVLSQWQDAAKPDVIYDRLWISGMTADEMLRDAFSAVARDGAAIYEVQIALQRSLSALIRVNTAVFANGAIAQSEQAMIHVRQAMLVEADIAHLADVSKTLTEAAHVPQEGSRIART